jgi:NAD(P)H-flavin reductase
MEALPPEPMLTAPFRVHKNRRETGDTRTLELAPLSSASAPAWRPGQFMMAYGFGQGEIPLSISGDPGQSDRISHTVRAVGPVSRAIMNATVGSTIGLRGPFGSSWPMEIAENHDFLLIAGGIGLAPLRPVIYTIITNLGRYGKVSLLVGARKPEILLYRREMASWSRHGIDVRLTVDAAAPGWKGRVGAVTTLIPRAQFDPPHTVGFLVGPEVMMRVIAQELVHRGVAPERLFLAIERNMKCGVGFCGRCQLGPAFICKDGPIFPYSKLEPWLRIRNL